MDQLTVLDLVDDDDGDVPVITQTKSKKKGKKTAQRGKGKQREDPVTPSASNSEKVAESIILDDDGDVTLIVGNLSTKIRVSSQVLRLASPVWKAMFSDRFAESQASEVEFPDDDEEALLVVLRVAHLHFLQLPPATPMPFHRLLDLAVICDKYDTVKIVRPFITAWSQNLEELSLQNGYEESLFIAWTFGYHSIYKSLASRLVLSAIIGPDGECLNSGGDFLGPTMPLNSIETILKVREDTISTLLNTCYKKFDATLATPHVCTVNQKHVEACHASIVGSLVRGFHQLGLFPDRPAASEISLNISELSASLINLPIYSCKTNTGSSYNYDYNTIRDHTACTKAAQLSDPIQDILKNIPSAALDSHKTHMDEQAKK
ncbi:hypothetical protein BU16DRAFT_527437 [Lophium mytilinum]|uniref:BTB domain-containing protein n=1 Tax=Lophium mytilinum TaxID=390894 RepID=A0A6A6QTZ3_9PEZI|nr:hypothetical protein BU16DRAFT_527437 [Lophium mytilinum]